MFWGHPYTLWCALHPAGIIYSVIFNLNLSLIVSCLSIFVFMAAQNYIYNLPLFSWACRTTTASRWKSKVILFFHRNISWTRDSKKTLPHCPIRPLNSVHAFHKRLYFLMCSVCVCVPMCFYRVGSGWCHAAGAFCCKNIYTSGASFLHSNYPYSFISVGNICK